MLVDLFFTDMMAPVIFQAINVMSISSYLLYLSISIAASISFGPSVLLAASNGLNFGRRKALFGVLGHISALFLLALVSISGLGAILLTSTIAFTVIKYLGAAYLIYIGIKILRSNSQWILQQQNQEIPAKRVLYKQSFIMGLSNPKALIFFSSLFPQFINTELALAPQFFLLVGTSLINGFVFTFAYALVGFKCKNLLLNTVNGRWFSRLVGSFFIGFGALLTSIK